MIKVALFTEGQGEQIFVRNFLLNNIDNSRLSFICLKLYREDLQKVPFDYTGSSPEYHFLILNVAGYGKELSAIKEREINMYEKGFS